MMKIPMNISAQRCLYRLYSWKRMIATRIISITSITEILSTIIQCCYFLNISTSLTAEQPLLHRHTQNIISVQKGNGIKDPMFRSVPLRALFQEFSRSSISVKHQPARASGNGKIAEMPEHFEVMRRCLSEAETRIYNKSLTPLTGSLNILSPNQRRMSATTSS